MNKEQIEAGAAAISAQSTCDGRPSPNELNRRQSKAAWDAFHPTITTAEELDALPVGSVILDGDGMAAQKEDEWDWDGGGRCWVTRQLALPATVLHMGARERD